MTAVAVVVRLWVRAVFLNAVVMCIASIPEQNVFAIAVLFTVLVGGFILTCPLIPAIWGLLAVFAKLPYHTTDKLIWLLCMLIAITAAYYMVFALVFLPLKELAPLVPLICGTSIAVVAAAFWTKSSIIQLNNYHYEQHLV